MTGGHESERASADGPATPEEEELIRAVIALEHQLRSREGIVPSSWARLVAAVRAYEALPRSALVPSDLVAVLLELEPTILTAADVGRAPTPREELIDRAIEVHDMLQDLFPLSADARRRYDL